MAQVRGVHNSGLAVCTASIVCALLAVSCTDGVRGSDASPTSGQAEMAERASQVMPFDLDATRHTFTKMDTGGVQLVVAKDPSDRDNIDLIRSHAEREASAFGAGDFGDPAAIHGMDMPGLDELQARAAEIEVRYASLPAGARITYTADDPTLVRALHNWFDAQTMDHSMPGMGG